MPDGGTFRWSRKDPFDAMASMRDDYGDVAFVTWPWEENPVPPAILALTRVLVHFDRVLKPGSWVFIRCDETVERLATEAIIRQNLNYGMRVVWDRPTYGDGRIEPKNIVGGWVGDEEPPVEALSSYIDRYDEADHALQKVIVNLIDKVTVPGDRLLEPFCGAAPGARAADELNLNYWGGDVSGENISEGTRRLRTGVVD